MSVLSRKGTNDSGINLQYNIKSNVIHRSVFACLCKSVHHFDGFMLTMTSENDHNR